MVDSELTPLGLWSEYKKTEAVVFQNLFPNQEWYKWTVRAFLKNITSTSAVNSRENIQAAIGDIKKSIRLRERATCFFPPKTQSAKRHGFFVSTLRQMVKTLSEIEQNATVEVISEADKEQNTTIEDLDSRGFLDSLSASLEQIHNLWAELLAGSSDLTSVSILSNILFREILATLNATSLLNPDYFIPKKLNEKSRLWGDWKLAKDAVYGLINQKKSDDTNFLNCLANTTIALPKALTAPLIKELLFGLFEIKKSCFDEFKVVMCASTILRLRDQYSDISLVKYRLAVSSRLKSLISIADTEKHPKATEIRDIACQILVRVPELPDISTIGFYFSWADSQERFWFQNELDYPLIPSFAHLYMMSKIKKKMKVAILESFCENFQRLLFWQSCPPQTVAECYESWAKWVGPSLLGPKSTELAQKISISRQRSWPLSVALIANEFSVTLEVQQGLLDPHIDGVNTDQVFPRLKSLLEEETLKYQGSHNFVSAILGAVHNSTQANAAAYLELMLKYDTDPQSLIDRFVLLVADDDKSPMFGIRSSD